jgi:hypothetical protein
MKSHRMSRDREKAMFARMGGVSCRCSGVPRNRSNWCSECGVRPMVVRQSDILNLSRSLCASCYQRLRADSINPNRHHRTPPHERVGVCAECGSSQVVSWGSANPSLDKPLCHNCRNRIGYQLNNPGVRPQDPSTWSDTCSECGASAGIHTSPALGFRKDLCLRCYSRLYGKTKGIAKKRSIEGRTNYVESSLPAGYGRYTDEIVRLINLPGLDTNIKRENLTAAAALYLLAKERGIRSAQRQIINDFPVAVGDRPLKNINKYRKEMAKLDKPDSQTEEVIV